MADDTPVIPDTQVPGNRRNWYIFAGIIVVILLIVGEVFWLFSRKKENNIVTKTPVTGLETPLDQLIPKESKSPEDFLSKVQEKSDAIQKNYDTNLAEFSRKRWERFFQNKNSSKNGYELNVLNPEIQKTADGSSLFKIKYRVKLGETETEMEDFYYLILSEVKLAELDASGLKANVFLTEEEIQKNLGLVNFAKIGEIK